MAAALSLHADPEPRAAADSANSAEPRADTPRTSPDTRPGTRPDTRPGTRPGTRLGTRPDLAHLAAELRDRLGVQSKRDIGRTVGRLIHEGQPHAPPDPAAPAPLTGPPEPASETTAAAAWAPGPLGDDCAVLPDPAGGGCLLFAIEGLIQSFVEADPWFAGYSAVMVNLSDVYAMGGRPIAVTDALWARGPDRFAEIWAGMQAAADRYGVPIVGGHTNIRSNSDQLAVAVLGRARRPLTSFDARPGDRLLMAADLRGGYREPNPFWNASTAAPDPQRLRDDLELLPAIAEADLATACKDISMGGLLGTSLMLAECSGIGLTIDLGAVPRPAGVPLERWLTSFPSFGFLLAVPPDRTGEVAARFAERDLACAAIGACTNHGRLDIVLDGQTACFWDLAAEPLMAFGPNRPPEQIT